MTAISDRVAARAQALVEVRRNADAIAMLQRALAEQPQDAELLALLCQAQFDVDPQAAGTTARALIEADPADYRGYLFASYAASRLGRRKDAIRFAELAVEQGPQEHECHAQLAQALAGRFFKYKRGRASARRALELDPHSPRGHIAAGNVDFNAGDPYRARRHYRRALELEPHLNVAQTNIALTSQAKGDTGRALGILQNLLVLDPQDPQARRVLDRLIREVIIDLQWVVLAATILLFVLQNHLQNHLR